MARSKSLLIAFVADVLIAHMWADSKGSIVNAPIDCAGTDSMVALVDTPKHFWGSASTALAAELWL